MASVGTYSGPAGNVLLPLVKAAQMWVKYVNSKGGLNGHPVNLLVYDDAGDPARNRASVQDAIERKQVIAFLASGDPITLNEGTLQYITAKRIPKIGGAAGHDERLAYASPMDFQPLSDGEPMIYLSLASLAKMAEASGTTKLGTLVCVEAQACRDIERKFGEYAPKLGFNHVYKGRASLAQPSFTAECLAARNAGVEVFYVIQVPVGLRRMAADCARQAYRPQFSAPITAVKDELKDDPNLRGFMFGTMSFPWNWSGTPTADEYQRVLRELGSGIDNGVGATAGWLSGKLLEKAAANLPEPPTSDALLRGLWSLKNDTLDGLTYPLSFIENQPQKPVSCWYNLQIDDRGSWVSPDNYRLNCRPGDL